MTGKTGKLYVVATPIGNREDLSRRALRILGQVAVIAAEDTRHSRPLLEQHGITTPVIAYHDHNETRQAPRLVAKMLDGEDVALISDAGTPLVSDPGYRLVDAAHASNIDVVPVPGPNAAIAALSAAGLPTDRFVFEGFLPARAGPRRARLQELRDDPRTAVFYESTHRIRDLLADVVEVFGPDREIVVARELTKKFESIRRGPAGRLLELLVADPVQSKGEFVVITHGAGNAGAGAEEDALAVLQVLLDYLPPRQAAEAVSRICGGTKNALYRQAVALRRK